MVREVQPRDGKEEVLKAETDVHEASGADKLAVSGTLGLIDLLCLVFTPCSPPRRPHDGFLWVSCLSAAGKQVFCGLREAGWSGSAGSYKRPH